MRTRSRGYIVGSTVVLICLLYWSFKASTSAYTRFRDPSAPNRPYGGLFDGLTSHFASTPPKSNVDDEHDLQLPQTDLETVSESAVQQSSYPARFPRIIWQTVNDGDEKKYAKNINTWKTLREFEHRFLSDKDAHEFVSSHFERTPAIPIFWNKIQSRVIRQSLLRYLVMLAEGGVFCDISSAARIVPDLWIPSELGAKFINAIIGVEYDDANDSSFIHPIAFSTRTFFSKPGHPIFDKTVTQVISNFNSIAQKQGKDLTALTLSDKEITAALGPNVLTNAVLETLEEQGQNVSFATFQDMTKAKLIGDVLVLPINAFASGESSRHAGDPKYGATFVRYPSLRNPKPGNPGNST